MHRGSTKVLKRVAKAAKSAKAAGEGSASAAARILCEEAQKFPNNYDDITAVVVVLSR